MWNGRWPEDPRLPLDYQSYLCECGLWLNTLHGMRRCWHCTRWCRLEKMEKRKIPAEKGRVNVYYYCSRRCRRLEAEDVSHEKRRAGLIMQCRRRLRAAFRAFTEG